MGWSTVRSAGKGLWVSLLLLGAFGPEGGELSAGPSARHPVRTISRWQGEPPRVSPVVTQGLLADGISTRGRLDGLRERALLSFGGTKAVEPETLRVIAIRVEFEESEGMTRGRFNVNPPQDPDAPEAIIDPPPHNRSYFMAHLEALEYYYRAQSYGRLSLDYDVYPQAEDSAYVLPSISVYNPEASQWSWTVEGLTQLFRDSIVLADTADPAVFEDADSLTVFIVFHAGPDLQTDIALDSPNDIPSFTIALGDSDRFFIRRPDSLEVWDGMMIPETVSQDGRVGAINGVLAHEFGHILGSLDLYNTCDWTTGVGFWCLMGSGNQVAFDLGLGIPVDGILPPSMCAWTKWWLGFLELDPITASGTYSLRASGLQDGTAGAYWIPIDGDEYFLLENRQRDFEPGRLEGILQDRGTGVVLGPVDTLRLHECRVANPDSSCFESAWNHQYDFGLPGSGLLIWHIDDELIWETVLAASNAVNCDYWRRGVDLEEADGLRDMGNPYSWYNQGSPYDPFFRGNNDTFDETSVPNSNSNFGAVSHVAVTDVDTLSIDMSFTVRLGAAIPGWPVVFPDTAWSDASAPAVADLDGDGVGEIVLGLGGEVWALRLEGGSLVEGWPVETGDTLLTTVAAGDLDGNGTDEVVVGSGSGRIYVWTGEGNAFLASADSLGAIVASPAEPVGAVTLAGVRAAESEIVAAVGESLIVWTVGARAGAGKADLTRSWSRGFGGRVRAVAVREEAGESLTPVVIAALAEPGSVSLLDGSGETLDGWPVALPVESSEGYVALADFDRGPDLAPEVAVVAREGWVTMLDAGGEVLPGWGLGLRSAVHSAPAVGDLDADGFLDLVVGTTDGRVEVLSYTGAPLLGWRVTADVTPAAVFADVTGDSVPELVTAFDERRLTAWGADSKPVFGWPLPAGADGSLAPLVSDLTGDGDREIVVMGRDGWLYAYEVGWVGGHGPVAWGAFLANSARTASYPRALMPPEPSARVVALNEKDVVVYPNPCRGDAVRIQYELGFDTAVEVTILDLTGQKVWKGEKSSPGGVPDEIVWPLGSVASGLYLCRVEARERTGSTVVFRKVAVVR